MQILSHALLSKRCKSRLTEFFFSLGFNQIWAGFAIFVTKKTMSDPGGLPVFNADTAPSFYTTSNYISLGLFLLSFALYIITLIVRLILQYATKVGTADRDYITEVTVQEIVQQHVSRKKSTMEYHRQFSSVDNNGSAAAAKPPKPSAPAAYHILNCIFILESFLLIWTLQNVLTFASLYLGIELSNLAASSRATVYVAFGLFLALAIISSACVGVHACRERHHVSNSIIRERLKQLNSSASSELLESRSPMDGSSTPNDTSSIGSTDSTKGNNTSIQAYYGNGAEPVKRPLYMCPCDCALSYLASISQGFRRRICCLLILLFVVIFMRYVSYNISSIIIVVLTH